MANSLRNILEAGIKADPKHFEHLVKAQFNYVKPTENIGLTWQESSALL